MNTENRKKLSQAFYPPYGHMPYSVIVDYKSIDANGSEVTLLSTPSCPRPELIWMSSIVFIYSRPEFLNKLSLYTLNYFEEWSPTKIAIFVPYPCVNVTTKFLLQMTTSVSMIIHTYCPINIIDSIILLLYIIHAFLIQLQDYTLEDATKTNQHSGFVQETCNNSQEFLQIPKDFADFNKRFNVTRMIMYIGAVMELILVSIGIILVLKCHLETHVQQTYFYTHKHYGLISGITCCNIFMLPFMMYCVLSVLIRVSPQNGSDIGFLVTGIGITSLPALLAVPIAIYFARTVKPPSIPYIFLIPTVVLFCCCKLQRTKPFVFCMGILINVMTVLYITIHGTIIGVAVLAEPFAVITNALVLILCLFCLINIFALVFTISAYLFTPKQQRPQGRGTTILHAVVLIPLLAMVGCYCAVLGSSGYAINVDTKQDNFRALLSSAFIPVILGTVTLFLKTLIWKLLDISGGNQVHKRGNDSRHQSAEGNTTELIEDEEILNP